MPGKAKNRYVCAECGFESAKWYGKCPGCGEWNSMNEEIRESVRPSVGGSRSVPTPINAIDMEDEQRYETGLSELDRVLGGGIVKGSLVLLGGDPGIGKSTLLLQICQRLGQGLRILYVSGEESRRQLKLRANRLGVYSDLLSILTETDVGTIVEAIRGVNPDLVMIDSIQTMNLEGVSSSSGSVTQVRESTNLFMHTAKALDVPILLVGHVNKDGAIAGPKVLEHIVDAVLYFEGDRQMSYRILRVVKNRYGSTNEIGVFEMQDDGLHEVENPSLALLSGRPVGVPGTCVACVMEGTRPIMAEVQGLATATGFGNPRRMSTGFDFNRLCLLLAVLEKRAGYYFSGMDAYLNIVGGLRLDEPAADLAVAMALVSSLKDIPIPENTLVFGEVGLAGEIRSVSHVQSRISEAARLGFQKCILPQTNIPSTQERWKGMQLIGVKNIREAFSALTDCG
jgi:DNA repair protein RadA/Sms